MSAEVVHIEFAKAVRDYKKFVGHMKNVQGINISNSFMDLSQFEKTIYGAVALIYEIERCKSHYMVFDSLPIKWNIL